LGQGLKKAAKSKTFSHELAFLVSLICMNLNASQWNEKSSVTTPLTSGRTEKFIFLRWELYFALNMKTPLPILKCPIKTSRWRRVHDTHAHTHTHTHTQIQYALTSISELG